MIPNGIEPAEWARPGRAAGWFARLAHPRLLYIGSLDNRVDVEQLAEVAQAYPDGSVVLVGPLQDEAHFAAVADHPNIVIRAGLVPRSDVVGLIGAAEACLIPHVGNRLTEAMSPLKLYEYWRGPARRRRRPAADRSEWTVEWPLRRSAGELAPRCAGAALGPAAEAERLEFVARHAWSRRFEELIGIALAE